MKEKMIVNDILCLFSCFFLMGCNAIKEDNTKVYVDSYSQTALQQADIIMDGIQSENCEEIADIFCTYIKKNHPELQTDIKVQFTMPSGLHSVLERPFSEANGRPFLVKRSPLIVC